MDRNPWLTIEPRRKVKGKSSLATGRGALVVDADMVIGIPEAFALAEACVEHGSWGGVVECFVLVMATCGLRPGEAAGLLWEDLDLPADGVARWVTVRRTHRAVAGRWLDPGEDPDWGPLNDRDIADTRRAPVHPSLAEKLLRHRELYGESPDGLVFHRDGKPFDADTPDRPVEVLGRQGEEEVPLTAGPQHARVQQRREHQDDEPSALGALADSTQPIEHRVDVLLLAGVHRRVSEELVLSLPAFLPVAEDIVEQQPSMAVDLLVRQPVGLQEADESGTADPEEIGRLLRRQDLRLGHHGHGLTSAERLDHHPYRRLEPVGGHDAGVVADHQVQLSRSVLGQELMDLGQLRTESFRQSEGRRVQVIHLDSLLPLSF